MIQFKNINNEKFHNFGDDEWSCHFEGGSDVTFTASGYNSKPGAITALCNHMIACEAFLRGTSVKAVPKERKQDIRAMVRARVKVLA